MLVVSFVQLMLVVSLGEAQRLLSLRIHIGRDE